MIRYICTTVYEALDLWGWAPCLMCEADATFTAPPTTPPPWEEDDIVPISKMSRQGFQDVICPGWDQSSKPESEPRTASTTAVVSAPFPPSRFRRWDGSLWGFARWAHGAALTSSTAWRSGCCRPCPSRCSASRRRCASTPAPATIRVRPASPYSCLEGAEGVASLIRNKRDFNIAPGLAAAGGAVHPE